MAWIPGSWYNFFVVYIHQSHPVDRQTFHFQLPTSNFQLSTSHFPHQTFPSSLIAIPSSINFPVQSANHFLVFRYPFLRYLPGLFFITSIFNINDLTISGCCSAILLDSLMSFDKSNKAKSI